MDFGYLLRLLLRRKWIIVGAMAVAAALTFFLIGLRPERYKSTVLLSTGIVNYKGINSDNSDAFVQQYQVENAFSNLMEFAKSRSSVKILTIKMLKHDLGVGDESKSQPFRQPSQGLSKFSEEEKNQLVAELQKIQLDSITDPSFSPQFDYLLDKIARAYGYDHDAILRSLTLGRKSATDYLQIDMITDKGDLAQYMADAYVKCFMTYYQNLALREKRKNVESYTKLATEKMAVVDSIVDLKFQYLKAKGLPVLGRQSEELVAQIRDLETQRQRAAARKQAAAESVTRLDRHMNDRSTRDAEEVKGRIEEKSATAEQFDRVRELTQKSLASKGKDPEVEAELSEARADLDNAIRSSARVQGKLRTDESKRTREDIYKEKVNTEMDKIDAEQSYAKLNSEIWALKSKLTPMVVNDEVATKLKTDEERALLEFDKVNKELIEAKLALENTESKLSIVENAQLPEWPEPDRRTLISIFAAIVFGTLTTIGILVLAYLDSSLQSADRFRRMSGGLSLLGAVPAIPLKGLDMAAVFKGNDAAFMPFRETLRKIRTQLINRPDNRTFLLVSTREKEGKTFSALALAHSLAFNNKKVLFLDTNFKQPLPEAFTDHPTAQQAFLNNALKSSGLAQVFALKSKSASEADSPMVDVLGNTGLHRSPSELLHHDQFSSFLETLRQHYDFILMEAAALGKYSDTQELLPYADSVIAVFNAKSTIRATDQEALAFLSGLKERFAGAILTQVEPRNAQ